MTGSHIHFKKLVEITSDQVDTIERGIGWRNSFNRKTVKQQWVNGIKVGER